MIEEKLGYDPHGLRLIPEHMHGALTRYLTNGIRPGSFLEAVLSNDLRMACLRADEENLAALTNYVRFFYNYAHSGAWGSPENYHDWITQRGAAGRLAMKVED